MNKNQGARVGSGEHRKNEETEDAESQEAEGGLVIELVVGEQRDEGMNGNDDPD